MLPLQMPPKNPSNRRLYTGLVAVLRGSVTPCFKIHRTENTDPIAGFTVTGLQVLSYVQLSKMSLFSDNASDGSIPV